MLLVDEHPSSKISDVLERVHLVHDLIVIEANGFEFLAKHNYLCQKGIR